MNKSIMRWAVALVCALALISEHAITPAHATSHNFPSSLVATGDFDGDTYLDIVVADPMTNECSILLNNGSEVFSVRDPIALTVGKRPSDVVAADFDLDGYMDLAVACEGSGAVYIFLNSSTSPGTFTSSTITVPAPSCLAAGRLSLDPDPDLAVGSAANNSVSILVNQGNGTFVAHPPITSAGGADGIIVAVDIGDLDNDKDLEELVTIANISGASPVQGRVISRFLDTDVDPEDPVIVNAAYTTALPASYTPVDGLLHQLDNDANGLDDLAIAATTTNAVLYLKNLGPDPYNDQWLGFASAETYGPISAAPTAIAAGLLPPPDGYADLAVVLPSVSEIVILTNNGTPSPQFTLGSPTASPAGGHLCVSDLAGDDDPDIVLPGGFISY